ncbi:MAG: hypothetical protein HY718_03555 [Planctomycetes bacterium]|nr:hypothetical protein [Planctomycetota bacterium]
MLLHLAIAMIGAGLFLRIVGREKDRRRRHLLMRLEELKQEQADDDQKAMGGGREHPGRGQPAQAA